ncbi:MAG: deoxyribonuclease IV [Kiritimatiellaeota bacterium]|nr:deoxyribonuclease IV [Kiritimatiellota bacterium]
MPNTDSKTAGTARPLGAHMSIAGGFPKAVQRARRVSATALQIFTKNQVRWRAPDLDMDDVAGFREDAVAAGIRFVCAHNSYLINPASPSGRVRKLSENALEVELRRAGALGCVCLVMHPGSPKDDPTEVGLTRVCDTLARVLERTSGSTIRIALENTAGQGRTLGAELEQLARIIERLDSHPRLGVCLDTCHAFAAGYDLRTPHAVRAFAERVRGTFGLERVLLLHLNDSKGELGGRLDRHEHIGRGKIGEAGFAALLAEPLLRGVPGILETPKDPGTLAEDVRNLAILRRLERTNEVLPRWPAE